MKPGTIGLLGVLGLLAAGVAPAQEPFLMQTFNQAALARHAPLPTPGGGWSGGQTLTLDWTSEAVADTKNGETVVLDGEALRLGLAHEVVRGAWRFGAELPLLFTRAGNLDGVIENWHDWFSLPNGSRDVLPSDDYRYLYQRNGQTLLDLDDGGSGLGDARLTAARCGATRCLRSLLQLPSGDADELRGGGLGGSLWLEQRYGFGEPRLSGVLALGSSVLRRGGPLQDLQRRVLPFGWISAGYTLTPRFALGAQFSLHAPLYRDSDLAALADAGAQLAVGLKFDATPHWSWTLGFQEDPIVKSSPDFSIHLRLQRRN